MSDPNNSPYNRGLRGDGEPLFARVNEREEYERGRKEREKNLWGLTGDGPPSGGNPAGILPLFAFLAALPLLVSVLLSLLAVSVLVGVFALFAAIFGGVVTYVLSRFLFSNRQVRIVDSFQAAFFGYAAAGTLVPVCWFASIFFVSQSSPESLGNDIFSALTLQARSHLASNDVLASLAFMVAPGLERMNLDGVTASSLAQVIASAIAFFPAFLANAVIYQRFVGAPLRGTLAFPSSLGAASLIMLLSFGLMNLATPVISEAADRALNAGAIADSERMHADNQRLRALFPRRIGEFALTQRYGLPPFASAGYVDPGGRLIEVHIHRPSGDVDFTFLYSTQRSGEGAVVESLNGRPARFVRDRGDGRTEYSVLVGLGTQVIASTEQGAQAELIVRAAINAMPMDAMEEIVGTE